MKTLENTLQKISSGNWKDSEKLFWLSASYQKIEHGRVGRNMTGHSDSSPILLEFESSALFNANF